VKIGIDFGTSYSAAAFATETQVRKIRFSSGEQFRTAVYFPAAVPSLDDFELSPRLEKMAEDLKRRAKAEQTRRINEANARLSEAKNASSAEERARRIALIAVPKERSDDELTKDAFRTVRRQWLEEETQKSRSAVVNGSSAVFGEAAIDRYLEEGEGHLVQSPKSMLGFDLNPRSRKIFIDIAANILEHIRLTATRQLKSPVRQATIGRPVLFRSSLGNKGTEQAMSILREGASAAGFDTIDFMEEPVAAALSFHRSTPQRLRALVLDVGGGTTDLAYVELGGKVKPGVLASWGLEMGGSDVDVALSMEAFMPLFGKDDTRIPVHQFHEAACVHDVVAQSRFMRYTYANIDRPFGPRLRNLQGSGTTTRLNRAVERTKIHLSEHVASSVRLGYIERNLVVRATQKSLRDASSRFCLKLEQVFDRVAHEIDDVPDVVFLTGGMSRSPYIIDMARTRFSKARLVRGDPSFGVVRGLALAAA
jgi:hypothetical chaperone protein